MRVKTPTQLITLRVFATACQRFRQPPRRVAQLVPLHDCIGYVVVNERRFWHIVFCQKFADGMNSGICEFGIMIPGFQLCHPLALGVEFGAQAVNRGLVAHLPLPSPSYAASQRRAAT
jgi:hypothetical protein